MRADVEQRRQGQLEPYLRPRHRPRWASISGIPKVSQPSALSRRLYTASESQHQEDEPVHGDLAEQSVRPVHQAARTCWLWWRQRGS